MIMFLCLAILNGAPQTSIQQPPPPSGVEVELVRRFLGGRFELGDDRVEQLVQRGSKEFPVYSAILADPKSKSQHVCVVMQVIGGVHRDRSQFIEPAIQRLGDEDYGVRCAALILLREIGSAKDTPPIIVLLSDEHLPVVHAAARTLAAIGDKRTVSAMDVWLKSLHHFNDKELRGGGLLALHGWKDRKSVV